MAKMFALKKILLPDDVVVERRSVFEATPALAKQLMALKSARNATAAEIAAAEAARDAESGASFGSVDSSDGQVIATNVTPTPDAAKPDSGAKADPLSKPQGKSA